MEFEDKKGAPSLESRWDNRLHASLLDFFGKQHDWPAQWTPGHGFNNIYLLRNPNFRFEAIMDFSGDTETGIRPQRQEYVDRLESAFLKSPLVAQHFPDPARAWQEAMRLNDGGISYIRESLSPLCDPQIKEQQLRQNIERTRAAIARRLAGFHQTDDREELRRQKLLLIKNLFASMGKLEKERHRLGQLIRSFTIGDSDIFDLHATALRQLREKAEEAQPEAGEQASAVDVDLDNPDLGSWNPFEQTEDQEEPEQAAVPDDEAGAYAAVIESKWVESLHRLAGDQAMQKFFNLRPQDFSALAAELATGAERLGLRKRLADDFRAASAYANTSKDTIARRQAAIAAAAINRYVDWLGFDPYTQTDAQRTVQLPGMKPPVVFSPRPGFKGMPDIGEKRGAYKEKWFGDWLNALGGLILDNVNFDGSQVLNVAENVALGAILKKMDAQSKSSDPSNRLAN